MTFCLIKGENLNNGVSKTDYRVDIEDGKCDVVTLAENEITCQPGLENKDDEREVVVSIIIHCVI